MSHEVLPRETPASHGRLWVSLTVLVSFVALYGLSLASDPQTYGHEAEFAVVAPCESDYRNFPDPSHNLRMFAMRSALENRGFHLNGGVRVNDDPIAAVRGVYGFISPNEDEGELEWRLMATRCQTCQPGSFLRLHHLTSGYSPPLGDRLQSEWRLAEQWLPVEVIESGLRLFREASSTWQADTATGDTSTTIAQGDYQLLQRHWERMPHGSQQYRVKLRQDIGEYLVTLDLVDTQAAAGLPPSCEVILHFRWMR